MKNCYLTAVFVLFSILATTGQSWQWAKPLGSDCPPFHPYLSSMICDGENSWMIGDYSGCLYLQNDTLHSNGTNDIYIVKYDGNGNELWSRTVGGNYTGLTYSEFATAVFDSVTQSIYLTGTLVYDVLMGTNLQADKGDIFVARMDLNGNYIWAKLFHSSGYYDYANIFVSPTGKLHLITNTTDSTYFDSLHLGAGAGLVELDSLGNCTYANNKFIIPRSGFNWVSINFIDNDLILYGTYTSSPFQIDTITLVSKGASDGFIARTDSIGNLKWIKTFGGVGSDVVNSVVVDDNNQIYFYGLFTDTFNLGLTALYHSGFDMLIGKMDGLGNLIWARQGFATGTILYPNSIITNGVGQCYMTGTFDGSLNFGNQTLTASHPYEGFIAKIDSNGQWLGSTNFGEAHSDNLALDNQGSVYVSGEFSNTLTLGSTSLNSQGSLDVFLAKHDAITGVIETKREKNYELIIYANPSRGLCTVTVPEEFKNELSLTLNIYDVGGKIIQTIPVGTSEEKIHLDLQSESKGTYTVSLSNGKKIYRGKIVFE